MPLFLDMSIAYFSLQNASAVLRSVMTSLRECPEMATPTKIRSCRDDFKSNTLCIAKYIVNCWGEC